MNWFALATCSALLSAAAAVAQKRVLARAHALEFSFLASAAVLALSLFVPLTTNAFALPARAWGVLAIKSVVGGVAFLLVMRALERNPISGALPLLGLTPAVTGVLAAGVLHDTLRPVEWAGLGVMTLGVWSLEARPREGLLRPVAQAFASGRHHAILGAVLLFAVSSVGDKLLVGGMKVPPNLVLFHQHIVYCALFGGMLVLRRAAVAASRGDDGPRSAIAAAPPEGLARLLREQWPLLLAIAVFTLGYRFFQLQATRSGPVALVLAVKRTSILYASLAGGRIFAEERLGPRFAAAVLIVAAGFLLLGRD